MGIKKEYISLHPNLNIYTLSKVKRMYTKAVRLLFILVAALLSSPIFASETTQEEEKLDMTEVIMHHVKDAHEFHILSYTAKDGNKKDISVYFPVILLDNGLQIFSSKKLYHGEEVNEHGHSYHINKELGYGLYHEKIYKLNAEGALTFNAEGHPENIKPLDFSITKNVFVVLFSALLLFVLMRAAAKTYRKDEVHAPRGFAKAIEPFVIFVRDEIAKDNIGEKKYEKYLPYLLTIFFFIWINNMLGLIPIFPGSANLSGNIAFTLVLAVFTLIATVFSGNKNYWGHIFAMPGVPKLLLIIMVPIEIIGIFTKPFALTVRLFANITAGHIIVLSLTGIIFTFGSAAWAGLTVPMSLFMGVLELLVALLQAFIFTMLSALFIGEAVAEHH